MSEQSTYQLLVATFDDEAAGPTAVTSLVAANAADRAALPAAASIVKDAAGALTIRETSDIGGRQGAAAGALLGGVAAHKLDTGIPDPTLEAIGATLEHSSSAAVFVVGDAAFGAVKASLSGLGAAVTAEPFDYDTDFVQQMKAGEYRGAMTALANRAESMVAAATTKAVDQAETLGDQVKQLSSDEKKL